MLPFSGGPRRLNQSARSAAAGWISWLGGAGLILSWLTTEHFLPWVSWHSEALTFFTAFGVAAAALAPLLRMPGSLAVKVPWSALPFIALCPIVLLQLWTHRIAFGGDALVVLLYVALCLCTMVLSFNAATKLPNASRLGWSLAESLALSLLLAAVGSTAVALAQAFDIWPSPWISRMPGLRRPGANVGQPNHLATLLCMAVASTVFLTATRRLASWSAMVVVSFLAVGIAATESRTAIVILTILAAWWQLKRGSVDPRTPRWAGPLVLLLFLGLFIAWPTVFRAFWFLDPLDGSSRLLNATQSDSRLTVWPQLLQASLLKPWLGWGLLQVPEAHNAVAHSYALSEPFSYAHNIGLDAVLGLGWPMTVGLALLFVVWFRRRIAVADAPLPWFAIALLLAFGSHALLEFPHAYAYLIAPVMFAIGLIEAHRKESAMLLIPVKVAAGILLVTGGVLIWSAVEYLRIEEDFRVVRFETLHVGQTPSDHEKPDVVLFTQLGALLSGSRIELRPSMPPEQLELLRRLALRYPWTATQYRYAVGLSLNGQMQEGIRQLQVIRAQSGAARYKRIQGIIDELARTRYPQLLELRLQ